MQRHEIMTRNPGAQPKTGGLGKVKTIASHGPAKGSMNNGPKGQPKGR